MNRITSDAMRWWYIPVIATGVIPVISFLLCHVAGVISVEPPLLQMHMIYSLKWGFAIAFVLQIVFTWRDHRRYFLTEALIRNAPGLGSRAISAPFQVLDREALVQSVVSQAVKRRCVRLLGDVIASLLILASLYVLTKSYWLLVLMLIYSGAAAWILRPRDRELLFESQAQ